MIKVAAIDLGASTGRVLEYSFDGVKLSAVERRRFPNNLTKKDGHYYWNFDELFDEIIKGLKACDKDLACVAVDTWGVDYLLIDKDGNDVGPAFSYRDHRHDNAMEQVFKKISKEEIYKKTGIQFMSINTLFQLFVHKKDNPEHIAKTAKILMSPDYLNYRLSGVCTSEYTIASTSQILNAEKRQYDEELLNAIGIPIELFPEIIFPGEIIGEIKDSVKKAAGLDSVKVAAVGCHDTASAVAAMAGESDECIFLSSGTWSLMGVEIDEPKCSEKAYAYNLTNEGGVFNTIRLLKNINGMWMVQQIRKNLNDAYSFSEFVKLAQKEEPLRFILDPNDPCFANPEDMLEEIKSYIRRTNQGEITELGQALRCVYDSLALSYQQVKLALEDVTGRKYSTINIVGGGCQNEFLNQMCADFTNSKVIAGPIEATALGNAIMQLVALGEIETIEQGRQIIKASETLKYYSPQGVDIDEAYERFTQLRDC